MADINNVFGEYDPNKPIVSIDTDKMRALLQALADLPTKLPKGPAEGLYDTYQFYKNQIPFINSETLEDALKEAALWFIPTKGGLRKKVRIKNNGEPYKKDLSAWTESKHAQYDNLINKNPDTRISNAQQSIDDINVFLQEPYWSKSEINQMHKELLNAKNELNAASLETLSPSYKDYEKINKMGNIKGEPSASKYIYDKLVNEYGEELGSKLYYDLQQKRIVDPKTGKYLKNLLELGVHDDIIKKTTGGYPIIDDSWFD